MHTSTDTGTQHTQWEREGLLRKDVNRVIADIDSVIPGPSSFGSGKSVSLYAERQDLVRGIDQLTMTVARVGRRYRVRLSVHAEPRAAEFVHNLVSGLLRESG